MWSDFSSRALCPTPYRYSVRTVEAGRHGASAREGFTRTVLARRWIALLSGLATAGVLDAAGQAPTEDRRKTGFFIELEGGAEYDSVVSLDELDLSRDEGDTAGLIDATVGVKQPLGDTVELDLSYNYSVIDYHDISEVDQNSHIVSADLTKDVGKADIGLSGFYISSDLDDEAFLELARVSPYVSGFFADGWFARGAFVYSDKTNDVNSGRDATAAIGEFDIYHFPSGKPWYINVGVKYRDEEAQAARFDYVGNTFKARYVHRLTLWDKKARFELAYRRLNRDYTGVTPSIGGERFDQRDRAGVEFQVSLTPAFNVKAYYTYSDWESNLDSVNFHQHVAGMTLRYRWDN